MKPLLVFMQDARVGLISPGVRGDLVFEYAEEWLNASHPMPLSRSLPLDHPIDQVAAHNFFANLLPEGRLRERVCQRLRLSADNDFALLAAIGGECAGALVIAEKPPPHKSKADYRPLADTELKALMTGHAVFAALTGDEGLRLSLAGAQDKLPVLIDQGRYWLPLGNAPSTHILKFSPTDFKHLPANETFVTMIARSLGLRTVDSRFRKFGREQLCEIARYDRVRGAGLQVQRLHQEDFCQALGRAPRNKYEKEGGPNFGECMAVVRETSVDPLEDSKQLWLWAMVNVLTGNSDAHGKNLAMLREGPRTLAPFYDLVCTRAYERLDRRLAMGIGGVFDPDLVTAAAWEREAERVNVKGAYILKLFQSMSDVLLDAAADTSKRFKAEYGDSPALEIVRGRLRKNERTARRWLERPKP